MQYVATQWSSGVGTNVEQINLHKHTNLTNNSVPITQFLRDVCLVTFIGHISILPSYSFLCTCKLGNNGSTIILLYTCILY